MKKWMKLKENENAQALVEFTLILPVLILLVFGMIEFGWLLNAKITLNSAAREGARAGAVLFPDDATRKDQVMDAVQHAADLSGLVILVDPSTVTNEDNDLEDVHNVVVVVEAQVHSIIGLYVPDTVSMTATARMRRE